MAKSVNEMPKASDAIPRIPVATPWTNVEMIDGTEDETLAFALDAADESTPRSCIQLWILSAAALISAEILPLSPTMPPSTSRRITTPRAARPSRTMSAPSARGTRCWLSQLTIGDATIATIPPVTTGSTIVDVIPSTHVSPTASAATPTRNHDASPRSRSQRGAEKTVESSFSWSASSCTTTCSTGGDASGAGSDPRGLQNLSFIEEMPWQSCVWC